MALPQDGQDANGLTKVTQIPAGKELMFIDPTTNEGGIITLEDLTKQILNGLTSQIFALDAGQKTIIQALNTLNSEKLNYIFDSDIQKIDSNISKINVILKNRTSPYLFICYHSLLNGSDAEICLVCVQKYNNNFSIKKIDGGESTFTITSISEQNLCTILNLSRSTTSFRVIII